MAFAISCELIISRHAMQSLVGGSFDGENWYKALRFAGFCLAVSVTLRWYLFPNIDFKNCG